MAAAALDPPNWEEELHPLSLLALPRTACHSSHGAPTSSCGHQLSLFHERVLGARHPTKSALWIQTITLRSIIIVNIMKHEVLLWRLLLWSIIIITITVQYYYYDYCYGVLLLLLLLWLCLCRPCRSNHAQVYKNTGIDVCIYHRSSHCGSVGLRTCLVSMRTQVWSLTLLSGWKILHCRELWWRSQMRLKSQAAEAVVEAGRCSSNSSLGTSTCYRFGHKNKKIAYNKIMEW